MKTRVPLGVYLVAFLQVVAVLILPLDVLKGIGPAIWVAIGVLFALMGLDLVRRKGWSRLLSIFVLGMNVIVRLLVLAGHSATMTDLGVQVDFWMIGTSAASMLSSMAVLYYLDLPDVSMIIQESGTSLSEILAKVWAPLVGGVDKLRSPKQVA